VAQNGQFWRCHWCGCCQASSGLAQEPGPAPYARPGLQEPPRGVVAHPRVIPAGRPVLLQDVHCPGDHEEPDNDRDCFSAIIIMSFAHGLIAGPAGRWRRGCIPRRLGTTWLASCASRRRCSTGSIRTSDPIWPGQPSRAGWPAWSGDVSATNSDQPSPAAPEPQNVAGQAEH
jgi:hypothetical protein